MSVRMMTLMIGVAAGGVLAFFSTRGESMPVHEERQPEIEPPAKPSSAKPGYEKATFGAGCFWCVEAVFEQLKGVHGVVSGYSGGTTKNPTYQQVCSGSTGHAEVIQVEFDPKVISFVDLLEVFWQTHDPTTRNQQGNDIGTQYRSAIFYHNDQQKQQAEEIKKKLDASGAFRGLIVTEIVPFKEFYVAEKYHQNYYADNPKQPYCAAVIPPKLDKLKKVFGDKLKNPPPK